MNHPLHTPVEGMRSYGARLAELAAARGDATAIDFLSADGGEHRISWRELDNLVNRIARSLEAYGVGQGDVVAFGLRNSPLHLALTLAIWRVGATTFNLDPKLPEHVTRVLLERVRPRVCIHENAVEGRIGRSAFEADIETRASSPVPNKVSHPGKILMSGGSTGIPKLMSDGQPFLRLPGRSWGAVAPRLGFRPDQVQLLSVSLSHNAGLTWAQNGLFEGHHLILFEKFNARRVFDAIDRFAVEFIMTVPTMLVRMLDQFKPSGACLDSLNALYHTAGPCPVWLKEEWIRILGPERVFEMYGSSENTGQTIINGVEWLSHKGSVGRGFETAIRIRGKDGALLPSGEIGEIFMCPDDPSGRSRYVGPDAPLPRMDADGFQSIGDSGWLDPEGYLYLAGRCDDVIVTGGLNVHPERIEAELIRLDPVKDVVVFGTDHREWGQCVTALIVLQPGRQADPQALVAACADRLAPEEMPRIVELRDCLPRDDFGKIRRKALQAELNQSLAGGL